MDLNMETADLNAEAGLAAAIEQLRPQFPQTQDLYREVCVLMFFRYGMTPTANKLYQLVRKGSMSAPAEALNRFWENLRDKSRVTIAHPDLPEALKTAAGELTATLWQAAQAAAHDSAASYRQEAQGLVEEAKNALANVLQEQEYTQRTLDKSEVQLKLALEQQSSLKQELAALAATNAALQTQLDGAKQDAIANLKRAEKLRQEHLSEQRKFHDATELAEQRFRALEARALLEVDRERTTANKLQKTLDAERHGSFIAAERQRTEFNALQLSLGDLRHQSGLLESQAQALKTARDQAIAACDAEKTEHELTRRELAAAQAQSMRQQSAAPKSTTARRGAIRRVPLTRLMTRAE